MHHKANNPEGWYGEIEKSWYAEFAEALRPAAQILIIGNGKVTATPCCISCST
jgi:hypothetical protein